MSSATPTPFEVQAQAQGIRVQLRAMYEGGEGALGSWPGTWCAVYVVHGGPVPAPVAELALWIEMPENLAPTFGRDRDLDLDLVRSGAMAALSRDWYRLAPLGYLRIDGMWAMAFAGELAGGAPERARKPSWRDPPEAAQCTNGTCPMPPLCWREGSCCAPKPAS